MSEQNGLQINWVNSAGGALGAVSSAIVLSSLGAAGTLVGAALGSLCITVGGAVYSHYLSRTKERVTAQGLTVRRPGRVREPVPAEAEAGTGPQPEGHRCAEDLDGTDPVDEERSVGQVLQGLPWKRILAISAAFFAVAMALIVAFELSTGRAVSTYTGGSSNTSVGTSIPGWSGTGQESPDVELDVPGPGPGEVQDGDVPQEQAPQEDVPQEQAPPEDGQQEQAPPEDGPQEQAPQEDNPQEDGPQEQAPPQEAPQEQAPPQEAPQQPAPEAPAP